MSTDIKSELYDNIVKERPGRIDYTIKAFHMLPRIDHPNILDIGCGKGEPTIELARMSNGTVTGLDIDQKSLDELNRKAEDLKISDRIRTVKCSMGDMDFPDESFDIIWAEGSIWFIGFEKGLKEWRRFIKPDGFLVAHEMCWIRPDPPHEYLDHWKRIYPGILNYEENLDLISGCGYAVLGHFPLPENAWWDIYFSPLQERIDTLKPRYTDDSEALTLLEKEQREIDLYLKHQKWYGSAYYIMQKS